MFRVIKASFGDVNLTKFLVIPSEYIGDFPGYNYDELLRAYTDVWNYTYNKLTKETDDRLQSHSDHIDVLPWELRKIFRQQGYWGKTDLFRDTIRFFCNIEDDLTPNQLKHLKNLCRT